MRTVVRRIDALDAARRTRRAPRPDGHDEVRARTTPIRRRQTRAISATARRGITDVVERRASRHEVERARDERERLRVALLEQHVRRRRPRPAGPAPSSSRPTVRSTPTTCRTCGATTSATWAAPHATSSTSIRRRAARAARRCPWSAHERRVGAREQAHLTGERIADDVVVVGHADTVTVPRRGRPGVTGQRCGRTGRDAIGLAGARRRVARGRRRPRHPVAHARAAPAALRVRGRRRGRVGRRRIISSRPSRPRGSRPGSPTRPRSAGCGRWRCSSSRRWSTTAATRAGDRRRGAPVREMIVYATALAHRPSGRAIPPPMRSSAALALLATEWLDRRGAAAPPDEPSPTVAAVMAYTQEHLADADERAVCAAVGRVGAVVAPPVPGRHRHELAGVPHHSRVLRAMTMLAETTTTVLDAAVAVGSDAERSTRPGASEGASTVDPCGTLRETAMVTSWVVPSGGCRSWCAPFAT